jgi:homoserine dehydrogenase
MKQNMRPLKTLFIGFGNVGQQLARILTRERNSFPGLAPLDLKVVGIIGRSKGNLVNEENGVDLRKALEEVESSGILSPSDPDRCDMSGTKAASTLDYDVLIELSTLSVETRGEPAVSHIRTALQRGKHAITANKGPVAFAFRELKNHGNGRSPRLQYGPGLT